MSRRKLTAPLVIFLAALLLRLGFILWTLPDAWRGVVRGDSIHYQEFALNLLETGRYEAVRWRANRVPGYSAFIAAIYAVAGPDPAAVLLAQSVLGALTCVLLYCLARRWLEEPWALACGLAAAAYYDLLLACSSLLAETLGIFLTTLFLVLWRPVRAPWKAAAPGVALGLACLTRPESAPFAPFAAAGLGRLPGAIFLAAFLACLAPWALRNRAVLGRPFVGNSTGAYSFYIGVLGTIEDRGLDPAGSWKVVRPPENLAEKDFDAYYRPLTRRFYREAPVGLLLKALAVNAATLVYPFFPEYDATFVALLPFYLWGLARFRRWQGAWLPALMSVGIAAAYCVAGQTVSRYRLTLAPFILTLGFLGLRDLRERAGSRRFFRGLAAWGGVNAALWLWAPDLRRLVLGAKGLLQ